MLLEALSDAWGGGGRSLSWGIGAALAGLDERAAALFYCVVAPIISAAYSPRTATMSG
jgi:hypothetical protein